MVLAAMTLGACGQGGTTSSGSVPTATTTTANHSEATPTDASATTNATLATNVDGTVTDRDGFVRFPGEPTRPDQEHYYVDADICGQFTKAFMEGLTGIAFKKIVPMTSSTVYACDYYTPTTAADVRDPYLLLVLNYMNSARVKANQATLGRTVTTNAGIPMDNFVATQDNGVINAIYFVLGPERFLRLDRTSTSVISDADMLALAVKLGTKMKDFK
jgi:hypothetical protein